MMFKISNDNESFIVNNIDDIITAQQCFPNYIVEPCNDVIEYASYSKYVQSVIYKMPSKWLTKEQFINHLSKINKSISSKIEFEVDEYNNTEGTMYIYLEDNTILVYDYYIDDFGDFSIGDFRYEDTY